MADYIYLLENRLSAAQRNALTLVREIARAKAMTIFLVGGAVRDLTSGSPVRDLDLVVQGSAPKLRKELEKVAIVTGAADTWQSLFLRFPGGVRMEFGSTLTVSYPKPGKAVARPATILEDLRRRDFTANAMALSLNEGSYGLLMDPLNGVADIENRQLRLASNYGFIEDPVRMVRAARFMARLGWSMDERTQARYETGQQEGYLSTLSDFHRGYELEELFHEEDPLRVLRRLESEGWMKHLAPFFTSAKVNVAELERLREVQTQLELQQILPDAGAANFPLLTAKLSAKEVATVKATFPRQGFVDEIESLEAAAREFATQLSARSAALPSQAWRLLVSAAPEAVLWTAFTSKSTAIQQKLKSFSTEWPQARQKIPYSLLQEMRITPALPDYEALLERLFFELMDGNLSTPEEMKAFLEPYSPPAPPPPVNLRKLRAAAKKDAKPSRSRKKAKDVDAEETAEFDADEAVEETAGSEAAEASPLSPGDEDEADGEKEDSDDAVATPAAAQAPTRPAAAAAQPAPTKPGDKTKLGDKTKPGNKTPVKSAPPAKSPAPAKAPVPQKAKAGTSTGKTAAKKAVPAVPKPSPNLKTGDRAKAPTGRLAAAKSTATPKKSAGKTPAKVAAKAKAPAKASPQKTAAKTAPKKVAKAPAKAAVKAPAKVAKKSAAKKTAAPARKRR